MVGQRGKGAVALAVAVLVDALVVQVGVTAEQVERVGIDPTGPVTVVQLFGQIFNAEAGLDPVYQMGLEAEDALGGRLARVVVP